MNFRFNGSAYHVSISLELDWHRARLVNFFKFIGAHGDGVHSYDFVTNLKPGLSRG